MPEPIENLMYDEDNEARIDRWHEGWDAYRRRLACPADPDMAEGWRDAQRAARVRPIMAERPEGYYHAPIGAFE